MSGAMLWRRADRVSLTIIAKATLKLVPDGVATLAPPTELFRQEKLFPQGPCLYADTDVVPYKPKVDVLYVGNAWAPRPVQALRARLGVIGTTGRLEKTVQVVGDRLNASTQPAPFYRMPMTWDRAARGAQGQNPHGVHAQTGRMPNLFDTRDQSLPIGLGAMAKSFPGRRNLLGSFDPKALENPAPPPNSGDVWSILVPNNIPFEYFQSAPADQQLDVLHGNESLWLENLVEGTSRVHTELPAIKALARVFGASIPPQGQTLDLIADTLLIDGVEKHLTITFRGTVPVPSTESLVKSLHVLTTIEMPHMPAQWPANVKTTAAKSGDFSGIPSMVDESTPMWDDDEGGGSTKAISPEAAMAMIQARMGGQPMPFQQQGQQQASPRPPPAAPPPPAPPPPAPLPQAEPAAMQRPSASRKPSMPSQPAAQPPMPKKNEGTLSPAEAEALRRRLNLEDEPSSPPETTRLPLSAPIPPHLQQPYRPASQQAMPAVAAPPAVPQGAPSYSPAFGAPPANPSRQGPDIVVRAGPAPLNPMHDEDSSVGSTMAITPEAAAALLRSRAPAQPAPSASPQPPPQQPPPQMAPPAMQQRPPPQQPFPAPQQPPPFLPPKPNPTVPDDDGETTGATMALSPEAAMAIMEKQKAEIARRKQAAQDEERARQQASQKPAEDPSLPRQSTLVMEIPPELGGPPRRR